MSACLHARTQPAQPTPGQTVGRADDPYGAAAPPPLRQPKYQDGNLTAVRPGPTEHTGRTRPNTERPDPQPGSPDPQPGNPNNRGGRSVQDGQAQPNMEWPISPGGSPNGRPGNPHSRGDRSVQDGIPNNHLARPNPERGMAGRITARPNNHLARPGPHLASPNNHPARPNRTWPGPRAQTRGREHNARPETQAGLPGGGTGPPAHQTDNPGPFTSPGRLRGQANPTRPAIRTGA